MTTTPTPDNPHTDLWSCPDCAFTFDACHTDQDGGYSCPACGEAKALARVVELERVLREVRALVAPDTPGRQVEVADDDLTELHPSPAVVRLTAERDALRSVVRHYAEVVEKERPHFPPFREWEDEDWADSAWTPAEAAAIRAALVAPDTPTSPPRCPASVSGDCLGETYGFGRCPDGECNDTPTSPTDTGDPA